MFNWLKKLFKPKRVYGHIRDEKDHRDFKLALATMPAQTYVDLSSAFPPPYDQKQLGSCFPAETSITMGDLSERFIGDIGVGNEVLTHNGKVRKVSRIYERSYTGTLYSIKAKGFSYDLEMTDEHPVAVIPNICSKAVGGFQAGELQWVPAKNLRPGDFIVMPKDKDRSTELLARGSVATKTRTQYKIVDSVDFLVDRVVETEDSIRISSSPKHCSIKKSLIINEQFAELIGLFLAEGSFRRDPCGSYTGVAFSFNAKETEYHQKVINSLKECFGAEGYRISNKETCISIRSDNSTLARVLHTLCGDLCYGKFVSPIFFNSEPSVRMSLLRGWLMGDGTQNPVRTHNKNGKARKSAQIEGVTTSLALHRGFFRISLSLGLKPGASTRPPNAHQNHISRSLHFNSLDVLKIFPEKAHLIQEAGITPNEKLLRYKEHDLGFLCRIDSIKTKEVENLSVYNLEVEGEHTYIANNIAVHNCTANGIAGIIEFLMIKLGKPSWTPDRLGIYWMERFLEGTVWTDSGAQIRDGIKVVNEYGVFPETMWTYSDDPIKFRIKPFQNCWNEAKLHQTLAYTSVPVDEASIKSVLVSGYPIVFGCLVYSEMESADVAKTGVIPMPSAGEQPIGGHCMVIVGYDDSKKLYKIRNSWGSGWGDNGYCYLPYDYIRNTDITSDLWYITMME